jgi:hypothetical protein
MKTRVSFLQTKAEFGGGPAVPVGTFVSRTPTGGSMPAFSRFVGVYSAGFIANAWEPRSQNDTGHALERGSTALLSSVGWHVFEEFWPDIRGAFTVIRQLR